MLAGLPTLSKSKSEKICKDSIFTVFYPILIFSLFLDKFYQPETYLGLLKHIQGSLTVNRPTTKSAAKECGKNDSQSQFLDFLFRNLYTDRFSCLNGQGIQGIGAFELDAPM